jgi:hypothetical protein
VTVAQQHLSDDQRALVDLGLGRNWAQEASARSSAAFTCKVVHG